MPLPLFVLDSLQYLSILAILEALECLTIEQNARLWAHYPLLLALREALVAKCILV